MQKSYTVVSLNFTANIDDDDTTECATPNSYAIKVPNFPLKPGGELSVLQKCVLDIVARGIVELRLQLDHKKKYKDLIFNELAKHILSAYEEAIEAADEEEEDPDCSDDSDECDFEAPSAAKKLRREGVSVPSVYEMPVTDFLLAEFLKPSLCRSLVDGEYNKKCPPLVVKQPDTYLCIFAELL
jgi:hypothetical protein